MEDVEQHSPPQAEETPGRVHLLPARVSVMPCNQDPREIDDAVADRTPTSARYTTWFSN